MAQSGGLVAAYSFNQGSGATVTDLSGNNLTGTIVGATWTTGRYGNALSFDGIDSYVNLGNPVALQLTGSMTIEAWVKAPANTLSDGQIVAKSDGLGWELKTTPDTGPHTFGVGVSSSSGLLTQRYSTTVRALDTWYHIAGVYNATAGTLSTYVNGVLDSGALTGTIPLSQFNQNVNVNIGRRAGGYHFDGVIDEVRIYSRALSQTEIQVDMNTPVGGTPPPPDTIPPTISMTAPVNGTTVVGTTNVSASAADNVGVAGVQFLLDGVNLGAEVLSSPFTLPWNTGTASLGAHTLSAIARDFSGNTTTSDSISVTVQNPSGAQIGGWSGVMNWPIVAVHSILLPSGDVLAWTDYTVNSGVQIWRPATNTFTPKTYNIMNLMCAGHAYMADGRLFIAGGVDGAHGVGPYDSTIFNPVTESFLPAPFMSVRRYYPTATTLGDGRILALGGTTTDGDQFADLPEIYDPVANSWTLMASSARMVFKYYPHTYLLPDGRILVAGQDDQAISTKVLNLNTQTWATVDARILDGHSSVMYQPGKIVKAGTATADNPGQPSAATTYVLDMTQPSPAWQATAPMAFPRSYVNLTVLPDGQVLATGGGRNTDLANFSTAVFEAELWSPITKTWSTMARMQKPRLYHSSALLLPDARVLVAGGGRQAGLTAPDPKDQENAEIFSPPYLFKGPRPVISSAPGVISYGGAFPVATPDAARIASVSLIALGANTHSFDENQRFVPLTFEQAGGSLNVHGPVDGNTAPPGPYMLFLVDTNGVPSVAAMVRLPATGDDTQAPTAPGNLNATVSTGAVSLTWSASTDNNGVSGYSIHRSTTAGFTPTLINRIGQTSATGYTDTSLAAAGTYYYRVTAQDARGNISPPSNEAFATIVVDVTPPTVSLTTPAPGATVSTLAVVRASASDDVAVAGVQFLLDGAPLGSEVSGTGPTYTFSWNTTTVPNGPHILSARARDGAGNTTLAADVGVIVSNAAPTGLVSAYSFNEGTGTTATDLSGNNLTGTITGATWTTGKFGNALSFNGTSARVTIPDSPPLDLTNAMTLEAWVSPAAVPSGWRAVMAKDVDQYYLFAGSDQQNRPATGGTFGTTNHNVFATATLAVNTWTHLAATYDSTTIRLFVNGVQVASGPQTAAISTSDAVLTIGADFYGEYFNGLIDEVRIYNRALSQTEIQTDMNTPVAPSLIFAQPAAGATITGTTVTVAYTTAGDLTPTAVDHVHFQLDSRPEVMDRDFDGNYQFTGVPAGAHVLRGHLVRADHTKIVGTDASVNFSTTVPDTTPPTISMSLPAEGATVVGTTNVTATASDDVAVAAVQFLLDGANLGAEVIGTGPSFAYSWDSKTATNGPHTISARVRDTATNTATATSVNITVSNDTTLPTVSLTSPVSGANLVGTAGLVASASDDVALAGVQFLLDGANLGPEVTGTGPTFTYIWDTTTTPNGSHTVSARARDAADNTATTTNTTITVTNTDTTLPSVSVTSPGAGANLIGTVGLAASASDNVAMAGVQFLLDGVNIGPEILGAGPTYTYSWNTKTVTNGPHTLSALARDAANNLRTAANVAITVSNDITPPTVSITSPGAGANLIGTVGVVVSASDNVAMAGVQFLLDGANLGTEVLGTGPTYTYSWNTKTVTNGPHTLSVRARDAAGNTMTATNVAITVSNDITAPTISVTSPGSGATLTGTVGVVATASDNVAMAGVQFLLDGANLGAEVTGAGPTYTYNWNTVTATNGSHTISARARDTANNTAPAANVSITVANTAPSGLIAAYALNEGTGTTAADSSGYGTIGTLYGATWTTAGKYGKALSFNGSTSYVNLGNTTVLRSTGSMTWGAWVYATASIPGDGQIISKSSGANGWQFKTSPDTGPHTFAIAVAGSTGLVQRYSNTVRALNTWYHVAGVYNAATRSLDIYVNGALDNGVLDGIIPPVRTVPSTNVNIGRRSGGYYFQGVIDEVRVYNVALTQAEIQAMMNTPLP